MSESGNFALCFRCKSKNEVESFTWDPSGKPRISGKCKGCSGNVSTFISKGSNKSKKLASSLRNQEHIDQEEASPLP